MAGLLSIAEAVEAIDNLPRVAHPARWLRRHLHEVERRTGRELLIRIGAGDRPTYRVRLERLRESCPELFSTRGQLARALKGMVIVSRDDMAAARAEAEDAAERAQLLAKHAAALEERLCRLERRAESAEREVERLRRLTGRRGAPARGVAGRA